MLLGLTLFAYMTELVDSPPCIEALASLDHHQALEFKKRWIVYELDQKNPQAHLPLIEFFLRRGLKLLPPGKGTAEVDDRIERIDREMVQAALREMDIPGTWTVNKSVLDGELPCASLKNATERKIVRIERGNNRIPRFDDT